MNDAYTKQVRLLLDVLPEVAKDLEKFRLDKPEIYQQQIDALKGVLEQ